MYDGKEMLVTSSFITFLTQINNLPYNYNYFQDIENLSTYDVTQPNKRLWWHCGRVFASDQETSQEPEFDS